jgi:hypothetical protein
MRKMHEIDLKWPGLGTFADAYLLFAARRNHVHKEGGLPTVLRPLFAIREIRDTRLLSV